MTNRKRAREGACQLCRSNAVEPTATLLCCDACLDRIVEAEDAGGSWRSSYLFPHRLVDAEGDQMLRLVSTLLPRLDHDTTRPCELSTDPPPPATAAIAATSTAAAAAAALRGAERLLLLLGSGASASYGVPVSLSVSEHAGQLARYSPVRRAALDAPSGGTYSALRRLLAALGHGPQPSTGGSSTASAASAASRSGRGSTCVVSTNIDGLAWREGLPELQLHGTAAWVKRPWLAAAHAATHRSRSPLACSGRPSRPKERACAAWAPGEAAAALRCLPNVADATTSGHPRHDCTAAVRAV